MTVKKLLLITAITLAAVTPAFCWYEGTLRYRDRTVDAALTFAYYDKCGVGQMPADLKSFAISELNVAGPSNARGVKNDVEGMVKKLGIKTFCEAFRRDAAAKQNITMNWGKDRPSEPQPQEMA